MYVTISVYTNCLDDNKLLKQLITSLLSHQPYIACRQQVFDNFLTSWKEVIDNFLTTAEF
jgi:hypothetical protein